MCCLHHIILEKFKNSISTKNFHFVMTGNISNPTQQCMSLIKVCLFAIHSGMLLSNNALKNWYLLTSEENKFYFPYAYHTVKAVYINFFPKTPSRPTLFHDICVASFPLLWTDHIMIDTGDTIENNIKHPNLILLYWKLELFFVILVFTCS